MILAVDTTSLFASVALCEDGVPVAELTAAARVAGSQWLLADIDALLRRTGRALAELDGLAVTTGPGSFTGVRIGVTTCRTLAWTLGRPLVGAPALEILAMNAFGRPGLVATLLDARKKEVYLAVYRLGGTRPEAVVAPCVVPPEVACATLAAAPRSGAEPLWLLGDGVLAYPESFSGDEIPGARVAPAVDHRIRAGHLGMRAHATLEERGWVADPLEVVPVYVRPSEAELAAEARRSPDGR